MNPVWKLDQIIYRLGAKGAQTEAAPVPRESEEKFSRSKPRRRDSPRPWGAGALSGIRATGARLSSRPPEYTTMADLERIAHESADRPIHVVFLCYGNACRSQMAEAFARELGKGFLVSSSAGVSPIGYVPQETITVMEEVGISMEGHYTKSLHELKGNQVDLIVDLAGLFRSGSQGVPVESRPVIDPFGGDLDDFRRTRDEVERTVKDILGALQGTGDHGEGGEEASSEEEH